MRKLVIYVLAVLVPVFGGMALVNYAVDPGHIYSMRYIDDVVEGARRGLNVTNVSNLDERVYKKKLTELYRGREFDYLVIGSSRVMTISEDCMGGSSLLNLGVSGSKLEDMVALYQICVESGVRYKKIIVGTDPTLFNANDQSSRWKSIGGYYYAFIGEEKVDTDAQFRKTLVRNLFDPEYFKSALAALPATLAGEGEMEYVSTVFNEGGTRRPDGSLTYATSYCDRPQSEVDFNAVTCNHFSFHVFNAFSLERKELFVRFVEALQDTGAEVIFWCCPYHPLFYERVMEMNGVPPSIAFIQDFVQDSGLKLIGSFDPDRLGLSNEDFYDAFHLRKERVDDLLMQSL